MHSPPSGGTLCGSQFNTFWHDTQQFKPEAPIAHNTSLRALPSATRAAASPDTLYVCPLYVSSKPSAKFYPAASPLSKKTLIISATNTDVSTCAQCFDGTTVNGNQPCRRHRNHSGRLRLVQIIWVKPRPASGRRTLPKRASSICHTNLLVPDPSHCLYLLAPIPDDTLHSCNNANGSI